MPRIGYARLSNKFWLNDKAMNLGLEHPTAFFAWITSISYASDNMTDGQLSKLALKRVMVSEEDTETLITLGFWEHDPKTGNIMIHDYLQWQNKRKPAQDHKPKQAQTVEKSTNPDSGTENGMIPVPENPDSGTQNSSDTVPETPLFRYENETQNTPVSPPSLTEKQKNTKTQTKREKTSFSPEKKRRTRIKPTFTPDQRSIDHAKALHLDPQRERDKFIDHWQATGGKADDWQAMYRGWCDNSPDARPPKPSTPQPPSEAWISRNLIERIPPEHAFDARRRFMNLISQGTPKETAAQTIISQNGAET